MIFHNQDSAGPESDERIPVIDLGLARAWAVEWTLLILLGASVLSRPTFRENYIKIWALGWAALVASDSPSIAFAP